LKNPPVQPLVKNADGRWGHSQKNAPGVALK